MCLLLVLAHHDLANPQKGWQLWLWRQHFLMKSKPSGVLPNWSMCSLETYGATSNRLDRFLVGCAKFAPKECARSGPSISILCTWFRHRMSIVLRWSLVHATHAKTLRLEQSMVILPPTLPRTIWMVHAHATCNRNYVLIKYIAHTMRILISCRQWQLIANFDQLGEKVWNFKLRYSGPFPISALVRLLRSWPVLCPTCN